MNTRSWQARLSPLRVAIVALALGSPRATRAEGALEPVVLSYHAPQECPSFSEFLTEVQRSTARLRLAKSGDAARHFDVVIERGGLAGRLTVEGGTQGVRAVQGEDCAKVSRLLAFATALAADPDAQPPSDRGSAAFPASTPAASAPAAAPAPAPAPAKRLDQAPVLHAAQAIRPPSAPLETTWSLAGFGFTKGASAPDLTWGGGAFAGLELSSLTLAPSLRIGAGYDATRVQANQNGSGEPGTVKLANYLATLEACSGALKYSTLLALPCVRAQGGARVASGDSSVPPPKQSQTRPFLELGLAAHLRWRIARPFFAELGGALLFPSIHDTVLIKHTAPEKNATVYKTPSVGALGELALGFEFGDQNSN